MVRRRNDFQAFARAHYQPRPTTAENFDGCFRKLGFEISEVPKVRFDGFRQFAFRFAAAAPFHHLPEERVVVVPTAIVSHRSPNSLGHRIQVHHQLPDRFLAQLGKLSHGLVEIIHVSLVMPVVVDIHRPRVNVRLQRVHGIRQRRQSKWSTHHLRRGTGRGGGSAMLRGYCGLIQPRVVVRTTP